MPLLAPFEDFYVDVYFTEISVVDCKAYFQRFFTPITPSWRKVSVSEKRKRKNAINNGHLVP